MFPLMLAQCKGLLCSQQHNAGNRLLSFVQEERILQSNDLMHSAGIETLILCATEINLLVKCLEVTCVMN